MNGAFECRKIVASSAINERTRWIEFDSPIKAQPGQFVMVWLPEFGEKPFSIAAMDPFSLLVVDVGKMSHALFQLSAGDCVWIKGPLGKGYVLEGNAHLLVGGGYGSAPLFSLAAKAKENDMDVHVCLGARSASGLLLSDHFTRLGCRVKLATEDGSRGKQGLVTQIVEDALSQETYETLYACGPPGMLSVLARLCKKYRINYQNSWEAHMRCGMGLCGSCEVPQAMDSALPYGWLACYDGPVFIKHWD